MRSALIILGSFALGAFLGTYGSDFLMARSVAKVHGPGRWGWWNAKMDSDPQVWVQFKTGTR